MDRTREDYTRDWAKLLKLNSSGNIVTVTWSIIEHLVNEKKNYDTAVALLFEKSWKNDADKPFLVRASAELKKLKLQYPTSHLDAAYLSTWNAWFENEVKSGEIRI